MKNVAVVLKTKEELRELYKILIDKGFVWSSGREIDVFGDMSFFKSRLYIVLYEHIFDGQSVIAWGIYNGETDHDYMYFQDYIRKYVKPINLNKRLMTAIKNAMEKR